jgi:hypothetical protein
MSAQGANDLAGEVVIGGGSGCGSRVLAAFDHDALRFVEGFAVDDGRVGVFDLDAAEQGTVPV